MHQSIAAAQRRVPLWPKLTLMLLLALSTVTLALQAGLWLRTMTINGPFPPAVGRPGVYQLPLSVTRLDRLILNTKGDSNDNPLASDLTLRINGRAVDDPHKPHDQIAQAAPSFSHWFDTLYFSLPRGVENNGAAQVTVRYPLRVKNGITTGLLLATAALGFLLYRGWLRKNAPLILRLPAAGLLVAGYAAGLFTLLYAASAVAGAVAGAALPTTAIIKWTAVGSALGRAEPAIPFFFLMLCAACAVAGWSRYLLNIPDPQAASLESRISAFYRRWGFWILLAVLTYSASSQWAGILRPGDLSWGSLVGLVPFSDAGGYFADASDSARFGAWSEFAARRPLAAAFRTSLVFVAGYSYSTMILLQAALIAAAIFVAACALASWRGIFAAVAFAAVMILASESYVPTTLTEPLGLFWALLAIPFFIGALRRRSRLLGLCALALMSLALLTRMGAMFTIPALALWVAWSYGNSLRQRLTAALLAAVVLASVAGTNSLLQRLYTTGLSQTGSNFSYTICGITIGQTWSGCVERYQSEVAVLTDERDVNKLMYKKAAENFAASPKTTFLRLFDGAAAFVPEAPRILLQGYMLAPMPWWFASRLFFVVCAIGIGFVLLRRNEPGERLFWLLLITSAIASSAFVYFDDGRRVLVASYPLFALFLTMGLMSPRPQPESRTCTQIAAGQTRTIAACVILACTALVGCLVLPGIAKHFGRCVATEAKPVAGQELICGGRRMSGVLVVADDAPQSLAVPTITLSAFRKIVKHSNLESYQGLVTPEAPPTPFGFVVGIRTEAGTRSGYMYIVPEKVMLRPDVRLWRFDVSDWHVKPGSGAYWFLVAKAEPVALSE